MSEKCSRLIYMYGVGMNPVSVSYRYIGTWYRFGMGYFGDIGISLNIL